MGSEADESTPPKLPLLSLPPTKALQSYGAMGMVTPPHHTAASVPFRWEKEPGKPRPSSCKPLSTDSTLKGLELPPRLLNGSKFNTTVHGLEGPCVGRSIFHSSRFIRCREVSLDGGGTGAFRSLVVSKRWLVQAEEKAGGSVSSRKTGGFGVRQGKGEVVVVDDGGGGSGFAFCGFSSRDGGGGDPRSVRKRTIMGLTKARFHFWAAIYEAVKQAIPSPRRSTNGKCKC